MHDKGGQIPLFALQASELFIACLQLFVQPAKHVPRVFQLQKGRDADAQTAPVSRLFEKIVRTRFETAELMFAFGMGGENDDRNVVGSAFRADVLQHLETIQTGHHQVQEDQVGLELSVGGERGESVVRHDELMAKRGEQRFEQRQVGRLVVHQQDALGSHLLRRPVGGPGREGDGSEL